MSRMWATLKRELMAYFFSPVGYLIAVLLYLFRGLEVSSIVKAMSYVGGDVDQFAALYVWQNSSFLMIVFVPPILTMRCFAEERRTGSIEVLLTAPVRHWEVVLGKWAAAFVFFCVLWGPTLALLPVLAGDNYLAADLPISPVATGYVGLALVGALVLAFGVYASSLTDNILLAVLMGIMFSFGLVAGPGLAIPQLGHYFVDYPSLELLLGQINVVEHLRNWFSRGLLDSSQLVFYISGTAALLFLTTRAMEGRRWR